ncbi:MAG: radical SAM family heme chaperone HemW [Solobacterium sp.]|nr:radical SAM family heme chaperone HemW [Solobacterium sp.]
MKMSDPQYLYLHVPFCRTICAYCDFCHTVYSQKASRLWLEALQREFGGRSVRRNLKTIYIGGGTPVCLPSAQLEQLLSLLDPYAGELTEYTVEINPEVMTEEKVKILAAHGVSRASIGYQTDDLNLLKLMNRHHSADDIEECMHMLRRNGISNISLDLMYSLPSQTMESLQGAVRRAVMMEPDHLSLYSLQIEENTLFAKKGYQPLDEDTEADMYEWICSTLPKYGFEQYEISNFARKSKQSVHNTAYWHYEDFYGFSCGASGKEGNRRYDKPKNLKEYCDNPLKEYTVHLEQSDMMFEMIMMNLRLREGLEPQRFLDRFGVPLADVYGSRISSLIDRGLLEFSGSLKCTEYGSRILNSVLEEFLPD